MRTQSILPPSTGSDVSYLCIEAACCVGVHTEGSPFGSDLIVQAVRCFDLGNSRCLHHRGGDEHKHHNHDQDCPQGSLYSQEPCRDN